MKSFFIWGLSLFLSFQAQGSVSEESCMTRVRNAVGKVSYHNSNNGKKWHGTAFFANSCIIFTNAHVILPAEKIVEYTSILSEIPQNEVKAVSELNSFLQNKRIALQFNSSTFSAGIVEVLAIDLYGDMSALRVEPCLETQTNILPLFAGNSKPTPGRKIISAGYPSKTPPQAPEVMACEILEMAYISFKHNCNTQPGQSGSPIVLADTCEVVGIHKEGYSTHGKASVLDSLLRKAREH